MSRRHKFHACCKRSEQTSHAPTCETRRRLSAADALAERYGRYSSEEWAQWLAGAMSVRAKQNRVEGLLASQLLLDLRGANPRVVGRIEPGLWGGL